MNCENMFTWLRLKTKKYVKFSFSLYALSSIAYPLLKKMAPNDSFFTTYPFVVANHSATFRGKLIQEPFYVYI